MGTCGLLKNKPNNNQEIKKATTNSEQSLLNVVGPSQIQTLRTKFNQYAVNGDLELKGFKKMMPYISKLPINIIENAFIQFAGIPKGRITWLQFCSTVSQYILGTREEKCRFLYNIFDKKNKGTLTKNDANLLNQYIFESSNSSASLTTNASSLLLHFENPNSTLNFSDFKSWAFENVDVNKALQPFEMISARELENFKVEATIKKPLKLPEIKNQDLQKLHKPRMSLIGKHSFPKIAGLVNLGNTCYMNSIIQCFFYTPLMNQFFLSKTSLNITEDGQNVSSVIIYQELVKLYLDLKNSNKLKISPIEFYNQFILANTTFQGGRQHDSHEFLVIILNNLHDALCKDSTLQQSLTLRGLSEAEERWNSKNQWNLYISTHGSIISAIFGCQTKTTLKCINCQRKISTFEVFNYFSIPIPISENDFTIIVIFIPRKNNLFTKIAVQANFDDSLEVFLSKLENKTNVSSRNLIFGYVKNKILKKCFQPLSLTEVLPRSNAELYAFEILTMIEDCEKEGKLTLRRQKSPNWQLELKKYDLLDIFNNNEWIVGHIKEILPTRSDKFPAILFSGLC